MKNINELPEAKLDIHYAINPVGSEALNLITILLGVLIGGAVGLVLWGWKKAFHKV